MPRGLRVRTSIVLGRRKLFRRQWLEGGSACRGDAIIGIRPLESLYLLQQQLAFSHVFGSHRDEFKL